jgi:hypothetical protein
MSSAPPPSPWFSTINFNDEFFPANTQTITLAYANATYLKRIGVATSVASLTTFNGDVGVSGTLTTSGLIDASTANFSGEVNFNSIVSPPHCAILPSAENDLCNKLYVDSQSALTAYQLYLNYSASAPAPVAAYKTLSQTQVPSPSTFPFTISAIGSQLIDGFFNTLTNINIPTIIPAGVWTLLCFCNVTAIADQGHIGLQYTISSYDAAGAETIVYTSPVSALLSVVSPLVGTSSVSGTFPATTLAVGSIGIGLKLFIVSNTAATRTGNIFFQNASEYSSILTSFAVQQAPDLLNLNNIWTGTNNFTAATTTAAINGIATISTKSLSGTVIVGTSGYASMTGTNNTIMGNTNGSAIIGGGSNCLVGQNVGNLITSGSGNSLFGQGTGTALTTGLRNTFVGNLSGSAITTTSDNTCLGYNAEVNVGLNNGTAIGANAVCAVSNTIQLGVNTQNVNCPNTLTVVGGGLATVATPTLVVRDDPLVGNNLYVVTNISAGNWNGATQLGDTVVLARQTVIGNSAVLNLTTNHSLYSSGLRIAGTTVRLGMGSDLTSVPTANIQFTNADVINLFTASLNRLSIAATGQVSLTGNIILTGASSVYESQSTTTSLFLKSGRTSAGDAITLRVGTVPYDITINTSGVTKFPQQTLALFGATVTASVTLALPLFNSYLITSGTAATITLPNNSSVYAGSQLYFRRSAGGTVITFTQTNGASVFVPIIGVATATSFTMSVVTYSTAIASDGVNWYQLYLQ